jgi:hypothetical protein
LAQADIGIPKPLSAAQAAPFRLAMRCNPTGADASMGHRMRLHEAILVCYYQRQVSMRSGW